MDLLTYALASFAVVRGFFPRAGKLATVSIVLAGCLASLDELSNYFGATAALAWRGTYLHSVLAAIVFSAVIFALTLVTAVQRGPIGIVRNETSSSRSRHWPLLLYLFLAPLSAALLHLALDAFQSTGVMLLWPFSPKRFAMDWLPTLDLWILTILILSIAGPELLRLVSSEIGAKSKQPRGRTGALIGLALLVAYIGARAILHSNAVALMESRAFHGEPARRAVAFPEALSLITWHGIAETEGALNQIDVNLAAASSFDPDTSFRIFKPEPSPTLDAARNTRVAQQFLATAQMPRASVEKTDVGYVVILRDLRYAALGAPRHEIVALVELDPENKVSSQEIVWARDLLK